MPKLTFVQVIDFVDDSEQLVARHFAEQTPRVLLAPGPAVAVARRRVDVVLDVCRRLRRARVANGQVLL